MSEDRDGFDFHQQVRPTEAGLDPHARRQRVEAKPAEKCGADPVELLVIALYVPEVARGAYYIVPCGPFGLQEPGDVPIGAPALRPEIAGVYRRSVLVDTGGAGNQQDGEASDVQSQAGYTLKCGAPVIVENLQTETRFSGPPLLHEHGVVSGVSVVRIWSPIVSE